VDAQQGGPLFSFPLFSGFCIGQSLYCLTEQALKPVFFFLEKHLSNMCHEPVPRKKPFHYDKSSRSKHAAGKKASDAGSGPPEFDKGHNGGPDHRHPTNSNGDRTGDTHYTWRKKWSKKRK
jgi:hypothetical protein